MRRYRKHRRRRALSEINVTPMVDVMLVLLVVFMVSAPLLTVGIDVDLPQSEAANLPQSQEPPLTMSIDEEGQVYLQDVIVPDDALDERLAAILDIRRDGRIYLRADESNAYGTVVDIMGRLSRAGFRDIVFVSDVAEGG